MTSFFQSKLLQLRLLGFLEGISFLLLLGVCMPLKYIYDLPEPTSYVGMVHGLLFIGYCIWVIMNAIETSWKFNKTFLALLAALLPFGTFIADVKLFRE